MLATPPSIGTVLAYTAAPVAATIAGAAVAAIRPPGERLRSYIQHFAAGVVFALVAGELLPDLKHGQPLPAIVGGFVLGLGAMMAVRALGDRLERRLAGPATAAAADGPPAGEPARNASRTPAIGTPALVRAARDPARRAGASLGLLIAVGIDFAVDGLLIGIGFAAGSGVGRLLVLALTVELLSLGLAVASDLREAGTGRGRTIGVTAALAGLVALAAALGASALRGVSDSALAVVLAFGVAALLFLVTEELLVEAHAVPETPVTTSMFFLGFLALFVAELLA